MSMVYFQCYCLQVDKNTGSTPKKRDIRVPSLASIEDMRMPFDENMPSLAPGDTGTKAQRFHQEALSPLRTPFAYVNWWAQLLTIFKKRRRETRGRGAHQTDEHILQFMTGDDFTKSVAASLHLTWFRAVAQIKNFFLIIMNDFEFCSWCNSWTLRFPSPMINKKRSNNPQTFIVLIIMNIHYD